MSGLRTLDEHLQLTSRAYAGELVLFVRGIEDAGSIGLHLGANEAVGSLWDRARFGFSDARMCAAHVLAYEGWWQRMRATDGAPWDEREKALAVGGSFGRSSGNPISTLVTPKFDSFERAAYDTVARFRLVRMAVELRATGACPTIADPYGGELAVREQDGRVELWSQAAYEPQSSLHRLVHVRTAAGLAFEEPEPREE